MRPRALIPDPVLPRPASICRRPAATLCLLTAALMLSACGPASLSDDEHVERAIQYEQQGDLAASAIELRNALQQNPANALARQRLGEIQLRQGDATAALAELLRARELGRDDPELTLEIARTHGLLGEPQRVLDTLADTSLPLPAQRRDAHVLRGQALLNLERPDEASAEFRAALELDERHAPALTGHARWSWTDGQFDQAKGLLERALAADPEHGDAWELSGQWHTAERDFVAAEGAYSELIRHGTTPAQGVSGHFWRALLRLARDDVEGAREDLAALSRFGSELPQTRHIRGLLHLREGNYSAAAEDFEAVLTRQPNDIPARLNAGLAHYGHGNWNRAEQHLTRALQARPDDPTLYRVLADVRLRRGDPEGAKQVLDELARRNPEDVQATNLLANLELNLGLSEAALERLERVSLQNPESASARANLATALLHAGDAERGRAELDTARRLAPESDALDLASINQHLDAGNFDQALEEARRLAERYPSAAAPRTLMGAALAGMARIDEAQQAFEQALALEPGDPFATRYLAIIAMHRGQPALVRDLFETALEHRPDDQELLLELANFEAHQGNVGRTHELVLRAVEAHPEALEPRRVLARYYLNTQEPDRALAALEPIRERYGNDPGLLEVLAQAQTGSGQTEQGINTLRQLARQLPDSAEAHFQLGSALQDAGRSVEARRALDRALELEPGHGEALKTLIPIELADGQAQRALDLARQLQQKDADQVAGLLLEGQTLLALGQPAEAVQRIQAAYQRNPTPETAIRLYFAHREAGDLSAGIGVLSSQMERNPSDDRLRLALASAQQEQGNHAGAIEHLEPLAERHPTNFIMASNLALAYFQTGDDRALEMARRAHALRPDHPEVQQTLAMILLDQGEHDEALRLLGDARKAMPENASIHYRYAKAMADAGRRAEARTSLAELLVTGQAFPEREEALELLQTLR